MFGKRSGARQNHINKIRELNEQGMTVQEISNRIMVKEECVKNFVDHFNKKKADKLEPTPMPEPEKVEALDSEAENSPEIEQEDKPKRGRGRPPTRRPVEADKTAVS
jgi:transposase